MKNNEFPQAIKEQQGIDKGEIIFLSKWLKGKREEFTLMKAGPNFVQEMPEETVAKGEELPVYMKLLQTYIYTGVEQSFA